MKKTLLLLVALFVFGFSQAQIKGGIKGGLNLANVDTEGSTDGKTGYHFGFYLQAGMGGIFIQPELLYSTKGAEDFDLSYIEVPILLRKNFAKVLNVHLGPQFGYLLSADGVQEQFDSFGNIIGTENVDIKDKLKGLDLSAVVGAGFSLPGGISGGLRYVLGLSNIADSDGAPDLKNRTFQVYVGYKLFGK